jgi:hypothetical protein
MRTLVVLLFFATSLSAQSPPVVRRLVETSCANCHNGQADPARDPTRTRLAPLDAARIKENREQWSRAERHLRAGTMPPVGAPRPDRRTVDEALAVIERELDIFEPVTETSSVVAGRLAKLLWNAEPDAPLKDAVQRDELRDSQAVERQARRMLTDPRSEAFVSRFLFPWLELDKLSEADPDKRFFPEYEPSLRDALRRETELFLLNELQSDNDPAALWTANYTFVNEQLAKHYGIANVTGAQFRRVALRPERAGLFGQGSILMVTSRHQHGVDAAYTTPATRAKWVLAHFQGVATPPPFPGAQPLSPELPITPQTRQLPANPCMNCHRNFFPLGYALENFDPVGRWRTHDQAGPVDASGALVDGTRTNGVIELRNALMQRPEAFRTTITEKLVAYAAGESAAPTKGTPETLATARRILRNRGQIRWSTLIAGVVLGR